MSENLKENKQDDNDDVKESQRTNTPKKDENMQEISTRDAYFASLNEWVKNANISQSAQAFFPWFLMTNYPQMFQNLTNGNIFPASTNLPNFSANNLHAAQPVQQQPVVQPPVVQGLNSLRLLDEQAQVELIHRTGGYEYVIAPFWKRVVAETIDCLILLFLKVMVVFTVVNVFDIDLGIDLDKDTLRKADDDVYTSLLAVSMDFLALSSDLLMLEIVTKVVVCFNEAVWTYWYMGATPGKALMNLKIVYAEAILPLQQQPPQLLQPPQIGFQNRGPFRALLYPAETPTFMRAFIRAVGKNLIMTLLFPMCFIMIFFKNNRTAYDILTKTVVVENQPTPPPLRHHQR